MGLRQRQWAYRVFEKLFDLLGRKCAHCGSRAKLEFDCIKPTGHTERRKEPSQRASHYRKQLTLKNLQVLCAPCNRIKGDRTDYHQT